MVLAVLANEEQQAALQTKGVPDTVELLWCGSVRTLVATVADAYLDLQFELDPERNAAFAMRKEKPVLVNSVVYPTAQCGSSFIRINAWPGMLERPIVELAMDASLSGSPLAELMQALQWNYQLVPDICGMITPRVIASIINEAYHTAGEGISSRSDIDTAMKLGTSYPYGPFEWARRIGIDKVYALLKELSRNDDRYRPATALQEEMEEIKKGNGTHFKY